MIDPAGDSGEDSGKTDIRFLGEMTTLFSHDIKNVLAIINENAGLLEDLAQMATSGHPLDPDKIGRIAGKIQHQVRRADKMVKRLNQVGHSMDHPIDTVDLSRMVETVCFLAARKADLKSVSLSITPPETPVTIKTDPFALQQLIWICIDRAIHTDGSADTVEIVIESTTTGARIIFGRSGAINGPADTRGEQTRKKLSEILHANLAIDPDRGTVSIQLPLELSVQQR
ncbi:MAG: hypothetical protein DSY89_01190 [Deltaproteobacteria bacterium]|nr:MAG: hypothetical protein DSY89_01190 [Deltaproteobacteria bacterium]